MNTLEVLEFYITLANKLLCLWLNNIIQVYNSPLNWSPWFVVVFAKVNIFHTALLFTAGIVAETTLTFVYSGFC